MKNQLIQILTLFDLLCQACALLASALKKWLDKLAAWNWGQRVKINAEILKDGEIKKSI